jgi:hypothetical protein
MTMDEHRTPRTGTDDRHAEDAPPVAAQASLPFHVDEPIPFVLTARARRAVDPDGLPPLRVLPNDPMAEPAVEDDPSDTRPARARALRRAGVPASAIATQLGVDELLVRAWTGGVAPSPRRGGRPRLPAAEGPDPGADEHAARRRVAREAAAARLRDQPGVGLALGPLAGNATVEPSGVTVTTGDPRVAAASARWLRTVLSLDPSALRVVVRVGPRAAADVERHRWARALDLDVERVRITRWAAAADDHAVEALLRVVDPEVAALVGGWCDALLEHAVDPDAATF